MTNKVLWSPKKDNNSLRIFIKYLNNKKLIKNNNYNSLHKWSIENKEKFWEEIWKFASIIGNYKEPVISKKNDLINSIFFKNCKLNYTQNLIKKNDNSDAIVFYSEQNSNRRISWKELDEKVGKVSNYFKKINIKKGDRIAAILPNIPETIISFLATAKIGAIWSSCSADFGPQAVIDRFKQIQPKILLITDFYYYNNKKINTLNKVKAILKKLPSVKEIIILPYENNHRNYKVNFKYTNFIDIVNKNSIFQHYEKFEFNVPLYILYSSGTTGFPKCIVHGAGGSLIQHRKEHLLHCNIKPKDKVFYFTTCGWMMWNWLVSCLASEATIYLYDGSPFFPNYLNLFEIVKKEKITYFGTGAKYLDTLKQNNLQIKKSIKLNDLKTLCSTGSPLLHETFEYIYKNIKKDIHLTSISGGTDIVSCFLIGNPILPVYSGEIQCKGLGMDVAIFDDNGKEIKQLRGELVCKSTFPSKPLYFWNDKNNDKYFNAYFNKFKNIWYHGDYAIETKMGGFIIYGRSDATLNAGGIRIGTAEIYRVVENIKGIMECIAVEQNYKNDTRIVLFVKLSKKKYLSDYMIKKIKNNIRVALSPKHVPSIILSINDIPKTKSGKIVELTIKKIINKEKVSNLNSLINPQCLKEYEEKIKYLI